MPIANGRYKIVSKGSLKPVDIQNGNVAKGTLVVQNDDQWSYTQLWTITSVSGQPDIYTIRSTNDWKMVLNVQGASQENDTQIIIYPEENAANEHWRFVDQGNGYFKIVSVNSNKNLNVRGGSTAAGAQIIQYQDANGANNELWQLVRC